MNEETIRQWKKERDAAVASLDLDRFKNFYQKWIERGIYDQMPFNDEVMKIAMYKMACEITSIQTSRKELAREWLKKRGYQEGIAWDGVDAAEAWNRRASNE